jgi:hypothetical protein
MNVPAIPGYTFETAQIAKSPVTEAKFGLFKETVIVSAEDRKYLRSAGTVLKAQSEAGLDVWYNFVGSLTHLAYYCSSPGGQLDSAYLSTVRLGFGQWIKDTCKACYDQAWLDYQQKIALRHTPAKKNKTAKVSSASCHIPLRYLIACIYPITATIKPFLSRKGHRAGEFEKMYQAWFKAVALQGS